MPKQTLGEVRIGAKTWAITDVNQAIQLVMFLNDGDSFKTSGKILAKARGKKRGWPKGKKRGPRKKKAPAETTP